MTDRNRLRDWLCYSCFSKWDADSEQCPNPDCGSTNIDFVGGQDAGYEYDYDEDEYGILNYKIRAF